MNGFVDYTPPARRPGPQGRRVRIRLWLAASTEDALKLVTEPRHLDGRALFVYWIPRSLVAEMAIRDPARTGDWPVVSLTLPAWFIARQRMEAHAA